MGLLMINFKILGVERKIRLQVGEWECHKKINIKGRVPKKDTYDSLQI